MLLKTTHSFDESDINSDQDKKESQNVEKEIKEKRKDVNSEEKEMKPDCDPGTEGCNFPKWLPR